MNPVASSINGFPVGSGLAGLYEGQRQRCEKWTEVGKICGPLFIYSIILWYFC